MRLLLVLLISVLAHAESKDQWLCTDEATFRQGNMWFACGIGEGSDEGEARRRALDHALDEFLSLCKESTDCKDRDREVIPKRTTCLQGQGWWKCYRLIEVRLD